MVETSGKAVDYTRNKPVDQKRHKPVDQTRAKPVDQTRLAAKPVDQTRDKPDQRRASWRDVFRKEDAQECVHTGPADGRDAETAARIRAMADRMGEGKGGERERVDFGIAGDGRPGRIKMGNALGGMAPLGNAPRMDGAGFSF